jgi:glycosyltransferase involved in cell wall biosynthesis
MTYLKDKPKITIGMPVYNGADTIKRALDSLLAQTFTNFELIISDNGSTDSTSKICLEYEQKDKRIKYIGKKDTIDIVWNFIFLVEQAKTEYFMWASDDDYWDPKFIEKNLEVLELHPEIVASISDIKLVGKNIKRYYSNPNDYNSNNSKWEFVRPNIGTDEKKIQNILEFNWSLNIFSIFRTKELKKCIIRKKFVSWDFAVMLKIIKFGDLYVLDDVLMFRDTGGITSTKSEIELMKRWDLGWFGTYFPYVPYTICCMKNMGLKIFLKNFSHFWYLNTHTGKKILREIITGIRKK